nr:ATP-binding cassette domain-containing protein [Methylogaea oryzae]
MDELLRILGLEAAQHVYPQRLSLGMSRRAAIARAFAVEPDLLLMDEPFVSLDPPTRAGYVSCCWKSGGYAPIRCCSSPTTCGKPLAWRIA